MTDINFFTSAIYQAGYVGFFAGFVCGLICFWFVQKMQSKIFVKREGRIQPPRIYKDPFLPAGWWPGKN